MTEKQSVKWTATTDEEPPAGVWFIGVTLSRYVNAEWAWSRPISMFALDGPDGRTYGKYQPPDLWMLLESPPLPESPERERANRGPSIQGTAVDTKLIEQLKTDIEWYGIAFGRQQGETVQAHVERLHRRFVKIEREARAQREKGTA